MTGFIPKEKLTAYQRWEVAAFDEAEQAVVLEDRAQRLERFHQISVPFSRRALVVPAVERAHDERLCTTLRGVLRHRGRAAFEIGVEDIKGIKRVDRTDGDPGRGSRCLDCRRRGAVLHFDARKVVADFDAINAETLAHRQIVDERDARRTDAVEGETDGTAHCMTSDKWNVG